MACCPLLGASLQPCQLILSFTFVSPEPAGALGTGSLKRHSHNKSGSHIRGRWRGQQQLYGIMGFPEGLRGHLVLVQDVPSIHLKETLMLGGDEQAQLWCSGASSQAGGGTGPSGLSNSPGPSLTLGSLLCPGLCV